MDLAIRVKAVQGILHSMPEVGFEEVKTAAFLAEQLKAAGYAVQTGIGGTGVIGMLDSGKPGPVLALRADMDALGHMVDGKECAIHSCGHDAHSAMVLTAAEAISRKGIASGKLKIFFQPAEERLFGALRSIEDGAIEDVDIILGLHLRPGQEAKSGEATPALYHAASYILEADIEGVSAHGARPHLGVNAIDAAIVAVNAVNAIHMDPTVPGSIKITKFHAGGAALNAIQDKAVLAFDLRSQQNELMDTLIQKATQAIEAGAAALGAKATVKVKGGVPAAEYDASLNELAKEAILAVLGEDGLLDPVVTPGGEDFHYFAKRKPSIKAGYFGLGCDLMPGLHHPEMRFNAAALINGVNILLYMVNKLIGIKD